MLVEYLDKLMSKASYDKLEDGSFSGKISQCPGVLAFGETLYKCQQELRSSLEGWLIVKIRHGDKLPVIGRVNLNQRIPVLKERVVHGRVISLPAPQKTGSWLGSFKSTGKITGDIISPKP